MSALPDPHVLGPDLAPTPFTADEIRRGCPAGRTILLRVEADAGAVSYRVNRFAECNDEVATIERFAADATGRALGEPQVARATWKQLQAHAAFPAAQTTISGERLLLAMGELDCVRYTVVDGPIVETFWFARSAPGMPVQYASERSGQIVSRVTMIADRVEAR